MACIALLETLDTRAAAKIILYTCALGEALAAIAFLAGYFENGAGPAFLTLFLLSFIAFTKMGFAATESIIGPLYQMSQKKPLPVSRWFLGTLGFLLCCGFACIGFSVSPQSSVNHAAMATLYSVLMVIGFIICIALIHLCSSVLAAARTIQTTKMGFSIGGKRASLNGGRLGAYVSRVERLKVAVIVDMCLIIGGGIACAVPFFISDAHFPYMWIIYWVYALVLFPFVGLGTIFYARNPESRTSRWSMVALTTVGRRSSLLSQRMSMNSNLTDNTSVSLKRHSAAATAQALAPKAVMSLETVASEGT